MENKIFAHAWVEYQNMVIDLTQPIEYKMQLIEHYL